MVAELATVIATRQKAEKREKELKDYFRDRLGLEDAEFHAGDAKVVSKLCTRDVLDREALIDRLGDLSAFEKESKYTEISVELIDA